MKLGGYWKMGKEKRGGVISVYFNKLLSNLEFGNFILTEYKSSIKKRFKGKSFYNWWIARFPLNLEVEFVQIEEELVEDIVNFKIIEGKIRNLSCKFCHTEKFERRFWK